MGNLSTPKSVQKLQAALHAKAKAEAGYRFYVLYDKISREDILAHAYAQCRANKGAAGVDGQDFADIEAYGVQRWLGELALALKRDQVIERLLHPVTVQGAVPVIVGFSAAGANWMVARLLLKPAQNNAAIRLAYIHNMGDVWVSLAPVAAGLLLSLTGYAFFDPLIAGSVAVWFIASTGREVFQSHEELIWPEKIVCGHPDHNDAAIAN